MRQNNDVPRARRVQAHVNDAIGDLGDSTLVNGFAIMAVWNRAQASRMQIYLSENEWGAPAYEVRFPASVLQAPYSLVNGMDVIWQATGYQGVVRTIDPVTLENMVETVMALVVLEPGK